MAASDSFSHSRSLFITDLGPMRFYVRPGPLKRQLSPLITHGGGIMCRVQEPGAFLLAEPGQVQGIQYVSSTYITDCVRSNRRLSPRTYRLLNRAAAGPDHRPDRAGAPDRRSSAENPTPEKVAPGQEPNTGEGPASVSCDQGPREREVHTGLHSDPAGKGASPSYNASTPGAPACGDPSPSTKPPASCDPTPNTGAPASCDPTPNTGAPASCDPGPSTKPPASCDPGPSTKPPASCDPTPNTGAPASCDPGPSASALCDPVPVMKEEPRAEQIAESAGGEAQKLKEEPRERPTTRGPRTGTPGGREGGPRAPGPARRLPFSEQEDITILLYVQENEGPKRSVNGNLLWKELEKTQLLRRTWQAMKHRYIKSIRGHKHQYKLPPGGLSALSTAPAEPPNNINQQRGATINPTAGDPPHAAGSEGAATTVGGRTEVTIEDEDDEGATSTVIRRLKSASRSVLTEGTPKPAPENGDSRTAGKQENKMSLTTSKRPPNPQENRDTDNSEDLQIFEIANMEFEVDGSSYKATVSGFSLKDLVMGEDSVSLDTQMQVDDVPCSPDMSDGEGLQDALTDMMSEFSLDISQVTQALLKNNGEVGSTRHFLRTGLRPDGFPIWDHEDDEDVQRNDPTVQAQLARKYGADNVAKRAAFLAS